MDMIKNMLLPGEEIEEVKRVKPFKLLEGPYKTSILISTLIKLIVLGGFIGYYLYNAQLQHFAADAVTKTTIVLTLITAVIVLYPLIDKRRLQKNGTFVLTNARIMSYAGESLLRFLSLEDITEAKTVALENGAYIVLINEACRKRLVRARSLAFTGVRDEEDRVTGLVLYSMEDPDLFLRRCPNLQSPATDPQTAEEPAKAA